MNGSWKILTAWTALLAAGEVCAQSENTPGDKVLSPYFFVKSEDAAVDALPLKSTSADVHIAGVIAGVTIEQVYRNEGQKTLEAVYAFPASTRAAVYGMEMTVGQRRIIARIEEKQEARRQYEQARTEGRRASLLEQDRPNVFRMNVANILPGDLVTVRLSYTELLVPEDGVYRFVYPTVVGPRYSTERQTTENANSHLNTPYRHQGEKPHYRFGLQVTLAAGMPVQDISCATHTVHVAYDGLDRATVTLDTAETGGGNRDFVLAYRLAGDSIHAGLMLYDHGDEKFFLAMVQPPRRVAEAVMPPREYIFINDVSGSMNGYPMDVSKKIMRNLLTNLRPQDRFNVMVFAGNSGWLAPESLPVTPDNLTRAVRFIDRQEGGGGTEILAALQKALTFPRPYEDVSRTFVVVTDGYVSVEKQVFDLIRQHADEANTFVFGIGSSVNRFLLEGMAHAGMGEPFIVLGEKDADEQAERFRTYISAPVLTQIKREFTGFEAYDVEPLTLPDVFAERPLILFGKYRGEPAGTIRLRGRTGGGRWQARIEASRVRPDAGNEPLRYLWARKRIQMLDDYGRVDRTAGKDEITALGLEYNLLTSRTSFVAVEETPVAVGLPVLVKQPLPLPQGVSDRAVGFEMALENAAVVVDSVTLFDRVDIGTGLSPAVTASLKTAIEHRLHAVLPSCSPGGCTSMDVEVDAEGKVIRVRLHGRYTAAFRSCIEKGVRTWSFGQSAPRIAWRFSVTF